MTVPVTITVVDAVAAGGLERVLLWLAFLALVDWLFSGATPVTL